MDKNLKSMATMHRMQKTGLELFYQKGYYNTSIDDILKELSLSKGGFYHHFQSKEDFFISIIQNMVVRKVYSNLIEPLEGNEDPIWRIISTLENALENAEHNSLDCGCVLGKFMSEFNGNHPEIMKYLKDIVKVWEVNIIAQLQKGKTDGFIDRSVHSEAVAMYLISSYFGIRTLMVEGNSKMLKYNYLQQLKVYLKSLAKTEMA
jgi:AcrR family transcriptional regulator